MREHIGNTDLEIVVGVSLATEEAEVYPDPSAEFEGSSVRVIYSSPK
jgi:hypothetical protein